MNLFSGNFVSLGGGYFSVKVSKMNPNTCAKSRQPTSFVQSNSAHLLAALDRVHHLLGGSCFSKVAKSIVQRVAINMINSPFRETTSGNRIGGSMSRVMLLVDRPKQISPAIRMIEGWLTGILFVPCGGNTFPTVSSGLKMLSRSVFPSKMASFRVIIEALDKKVNCNHGNPILSMQDGSIMHDHCRAASWLRERGQ